MLRNKKLLGMLFGIESFCFLWYKVSMVQLLLPHLTATINGSSLFIMFSCSGSLLFLLCPDLHFPGYKYAKMDAGSSKNSESTMKIIPLTEQLCELEELGLAAYCFLLSVPVRTGVYMLHNSVTEHPSFILQLVAKVWQVLSSCC